MTTSAMTVIFTIQLFRQLKAEALDIGKGTRGTIVLHDKETVIATSSRKVKIYVYFLLFCPAAIVTPKLISSIHSPHELIVADDALGIGDGNSRTILQPRRTVPTPAGWQLDDMTITTFRSIQALADTLPFWTVSESPLKTTYCGWYVHMRMLTIHKVLSICT